MDDNDNNNDSEVDDQSLQREEEGGDTDTDEDEDEDEDEEEEDTDEEEEDQPQIRQQRFNDKLQSIPQHKNIVATAAYRAARNERRIKSIEILQRQDEFPLRQRRKIDTAVEEIIDNLGDDNAAVAVGDDNGDNTDDNTRINERRYNLLLTLQRLNKLPERQRNKIDVLVDMFLDDLENDIYEMLCDQNEENYQGLDSNRDTEAEVETAIRFYPNLLSKRKELTWDFINRERDLGWNERTDGDGCFPIQCVCDIYSADDEDAHCNVKALPFIAILAILAIELNQFTEEERGGLLIHDEYGDSILHKLTRCSDSIYGEHHNRLVENVCLTQLIQLRRRDLFKKEDICDCYSLISNLRFFDDYFPENIFRFLVEWDPTLLLQPDNHNYDKDLPLHLTTYSSVIQGFQVVFDYLICYYPNKKGICLLFTKNYSNKTPFQKACDRYKYAPVMKVVEDTLTRYAVDGTPLHVVDAILTAATDGDVHLDCVYTLLRRHPAVLMELLSVRPNNNNNDGDDNDNDNIDGGGGGDDDDNDNDNDNADNGNNDDDDSPTWSRKKRRT